MCRRWKAGLCAGEQDKRREGRPPLVIDSLQSFGGNEEVNAVHSIHYEIGNDDLDRVVVTENPQSCISAVSLIDDVAEACQRHCDVVARVTNVVNDQDSHANQFPEGDDNVNLKPVVSVSHHVILSVTDSEKCTTGGDLLSSRYGWIIATIKLPVRRRSSHV